MPEINQYIIESTGKKIRTFLYEIAEGTTNYRSLYSLTQQVEHQYHGRFIIELIQNAHDALFPINTDSESLGRIEIIYKQDENDFALYVANDGVPFSQSNFESLSQLGQSNKDPEQSIGNKGIGFRSVLEITDAPEIYSQASPNGNYFDGYCFKFSPEIISILKDSVLRLFKGEVCVKAPFVDSPLVDWDEPLLEKFRENVSQTAERLFMEPEKWLSEEMNYLSPYLLPVPIEVQNDCSSAKEFECRGFATLIRFPLKDTATSNLVCEKLNAFGANTLLFLERAKSLVLAINDDRRELIRTQKTISGTKLNGKEIFIKKKSDNSDSSKYLLWIRDVRLTNAPDDVQAAVKQLPGKWPELKDISISIGVKIGQSPEIGVFSIFLPTHLQTGCAAHINAPFFGDMSRTHIEFGDENSTSYSNDAIYNRFLLSQAAELALSVIRDELAGGELDKARASAILDLLAPCGNDQNACNRWWQFLEDAARKLEIDVKKSLWFISDRCWSSLSDTLLIPEKEGRKLITDDFLRKHAKFQIYSKEINSRRAAIKNLSRRHSICTDPTIEDLAETIEVIASVLHKEQGTNWNDFWTDIAVLLNGNCIALAGKHVLLGSDGKLYSGGYGDCTVFFNPRRGGIDGEEGAVDFDITDVPESLKNCVAFLNEQIQEQSVRDMLAKSNLVSTFRRESILTNVLLAEIPDLPVPHDDIYKSLLCKDILLWALHLMQGSAEDFITRNSPQLKRLPVPCQGGWYPMSDSSFGKGWEGTLGDFTYSYLDNVNDPDTNDAKTRLLLPPNDLSWDEKGANYIGFMRIVGVFDGLRLISEHLHVDTTYRVLILPRKPLPGWSNDEWTRYCESVSGQKTTYRDNYEVEAFYTIPGLNKFHQFNESSRKLFMKVILGSITGWKEDWTKLWIRRFSGRNERLSLSSPLLYILSNLKWIGIPAQQQDGIFEWYTPKERWFVPSHELLGGRAWKLGFLRPLPIELAKQLEENKKLAEVMKQLGTPSFSRETSSPSLQFLDALAAAVEHGEVRNKDVFLGQVRSAWRMFEPTPNTQLPQRLLVQRGALGLILETPNQDEPLYLPDTQKVIFSALRQFELPVIAIEPSDARRLADHFTMVYPNSVFLVSSLKPSPYVDNQLWDNTPRNRLQDDPEFQWLIPILLTIAAFHGPQSHGVNTDAFERLVVTLQEVKIAVVGSLAAGLSRENIQVSPPISVDALWLSEPNVLLISESCKKNASHLSEALASVMDREELEIPIKLVLTSTGSKPELEKIINALAQLKLSREHFNDVREYLRNDVGQVIQFITPLILILHPKENVDDLQSLNTVEALNAFISKLNDEIFDGNIIGLARESKSMYEFGSKVFDMFNEQRPGQLQMSEWNSVLSHRGEAPLQNNEARKMFKVHINSSAQVIRSLLAKLITRQDGLGQFKNMLDQIDGIECPESFSKDYWFVNFNLAHSVIIKLLKEWGANNNEVKAVSGSKSLEELKSSLKDAGVEVEIDPLQIARENRNLLRKDIDRLKEIGFAWASENDAGNLEAWKLKTEDLIKQLESDIENSCFTHKWEPKSVWGLLLKLARNLARNNANLNNFSSLLENVSNFDSLEEELGLSNDDINELRHTYKIFLEDVYREKRLINICGKVYDFSEDSLTGLGVHIYGDQADNNMTNKSKLDFNKIASLSNIKSDSNFPSSERAQVSRRQPNYQTSSNENLIGLAGEIHAFHKLQLTFGKTVVSPSNWISSNSLKEYPDNKINDGFGCDFIINLESETFYIEVKSSAEVNESFILAPSEVRLAKDLASRSQYKNIEKFIILRVLNALTSDPEFEFLPNPYEESSRELFVMDEVDVRVRYRRSVRANG